ncbi:hypothetical protein Plav_1533 [Parvibaculum lavamentivorans DS-1]|uniref:Uncharacterized protein n=1 Tax=Parvibaculum lavamentivorans (strain DS-1 / DSM 13023 / NCIMB 13966) TaxID=402881 RepID=A7HTB9_PARL1|nr:hypothetical protein [Parvibaculum lavamentivorans]ABS63152.1 hypothetical protein Plav_1533 [Parvibaculum lavamentivorans DS-1]
MIGFSARKKAAGSLLQLEVAPRPAIATIAFLAFLGVIAVTGMARASMLTDEYVRDSLLERSASQTQLRLSDEDVLRNQDLVRKEKSMRGNGSGVVPFAVRDTGRVLRPAGFALEPASAEMPPLPAGHFPRAPPMPVQGMAGQTNV